MTRHPVWKRRLVLVAAIVMGLCAVLTTALPVALAAHESGARVGFWAVMIVVETALCLLLLRDWHRSRPSRAGDHHPGEHGELNRQPHREGGPQA